MAFKVTYSEKWKIIKKYVNYKIDLRKTISTKDKKLITYYYNKITPFIKGPVIKYKPKKKKNLKKGKQLAQNKNMPLTNTVFIPQRVPVKSARVKIKNNRLLIRKKYFFEQIILFDKEKLLNNPIGYLNEVIPDGKDCWRIMCGPYYFIRGSYCDKDLLIEAILELLDKYDQQEEFWVYGIVDMKSAVEKEEEQETIRKEKKAADRRRKREKRVKLRMK